MRSFKPYRACLRRALLIGAAVCASTSMSVAETTETIVLNVENDLFTGSDNNYTNGLSITWSSDEIAKYPEASFVAGASKALKIFPGFGNESADNYISFSLISEMNTPSRIDQIEPDPNDQPYSGIMLLSTGLYARQDDWTHAWDIKIGAVGPVTQTDHIQIEFHDLIGAEEPLGWDSQLPNEAIFNIGYLAGKTLARNSLENGLEWRTVGLGNASLGNYQTSVGGGAIFELGNDLEDTVSTTSLGQGFGSVLGVGTQPTDRVKYTFYGGVGVNAISHFLPLDGTAFRDSRSVDYDPVAAFLSAGATLRYGRFVASFGLSRGATPFDDTDADLDYGSISIGWQY
ncbi:MAG: lipid A deacylase LpxR family protein [Henriciella sp.]